jgi:DNA polymerase elongation subunit (family B)
MTKPLVAFDIEVFRDYFLAKFTRVDNGAVREFEMFDGQPLDRRNLLDTMRRSTLIGFNSRNFDAPLIGYALRGASCEEIKAAAEYIIGARVQGWMFERERACEITGLDHIDLIEVAPGIVSLKIYGGRMHAKKMQDLPYHHDALIETAERRAVVRDYCGNDLDTTIALFRKFEKQIELRAKMSQEYGVDLRSKSDAQIAEAVIKDKVSRLIGYKISKPEIVPRSFKYRFPNFLRAKSETFAGVLKMVADANFVVDAGGYVKMPEALAEAKIGIGQGVYRMGIGGLHSSEKSIAHEANDDVMLVDRDVASFYPAIIIETELFPKHLGRHFLHVYRDIRDTRIRAKNSGDKVTADTLKIVLNGSFGKFGNPYSTLYAPDLLIQTTVTGQLALLMLIERIEAAGIPVVSANTDGIVIKCPRRRRQDLFDIIAGWELETGFETEETPYRAIYSRDVNNYFALKDKGGFKLKGAYAPPEPVASSWPSPHNQICVDAVCDYLEYGIPLDVTVHACSDIRQFVTIRTVKGGAIYKGQRLGKAVRWIVSTKGDEPIRYESNGNKVAGTDRCRPMMELPDQMPDDIDYEFYVREARDILKDIGYANN